MVKSHSLDIECPPGLGAGNRAEPTVLPQKRQDRRPALGGRSRPGSALCAWAGRRVGGSTWPSGAVSRPSRLTSCPTPENPTFREAGPRRGTVAASLRCVAARRTASDSVFEKSRISSLRDVVQSPPQRRSRPAALESVRAWAWPRIAHAQSVFRPRHCVQRCPRKYVYILVCELGVNGIALLHLLGHFSTG